MDRNLAIASIRLAGKAECPRVNKLKLYIVNKMVDLVPYLGRSTKDKETT